jgi:hypothetical protein
MERDYPGSDRAKDRIQDEIKQTTGGKTLPVACTCGRLPMIVSVAYGMVRVACTCGFQGLNSRTIDEAVQDWNKQVQRLMIEAMR